MKVLKNLNDMLVHEIQIMYNAEELQILALQRMIDKTTNPELKNAFEQHLEETKKHKERLERIGKILNIDPGDEGNPAIKGLIVEGEKVLHKDATPETLDATLIAGVQKIEHYEIAGYGTAAYLAETLGLIPVWELLSQTLKEEKDTDNKLSNLAKSKINVKAGKVGSR
jgi:ferritin-like metal-binding protein YciE